MVPVLYFMNKKQKHGKQICSQFVGGIFILANWVMFTTDTTRLRKWTNGQMHFDFQVGQEFIYFMEGFCNLASVPYAKFSKKREIMTHYKIEWAGPIFTTYLEILQTVEYTFKFL